MTKLYPILFITGIFISGLYCISKELPENRKSIPIQEVLGDINSLIDHFELLETIKQFDKLTSTIINGNYKNIDEVRKHFEISNEGIFSRFFSNQDKTIEDLIKRLNEEKHAIAKTSIKWSILKSAKVIATEFYYVRDVWLKLKDANCVITESKATFNDINLKVNKIHDDLKKLENFISKAMSKDRNERENESIMNKINSRTTSMREEVRKLKISIENIRVKAEKGIETIRECKKDSNMRAIINGIHAVSSGIQIGASLFTGVASRGHLVWKGLELGGHVLNTYWNIKNSIASETALKELRAELNEANKQEKVLDELNDNISQAQSIEERYIQTYLPDDLRDDDI